MRAETARDDCIGRLASAIPEERLLIDEASRRLFGQDISGDAAMPLLVVQPATTEELAEVVRVLSPLDVVFVPRGGGMSYSSGYVCQRDGVVCIDTGAMADVLDINTDDMYVTVQAGCSWRRLHEALEPLGVRTPFWGTLSGMKATVGGSLSQNSIFWGSCRYGSAADSVIGFDVVLADGEILRTGAAAHTASTPFFRHYGPDLTGLFTADSGALGLKATATLKLIPAAEARAFVSFDFERHDQLLAAMSEVSRRRLAEACFGMDPRLQAVRKQRDSLMSDARALKGVMTGQGSLLRGLKEAGRVALAGRGFMDEERFAVHYVVEEATEAAALAGAERIGDICLAAGGREIENSVPKIIRASPFGPLNGMVGPGGERWLPIHGLMPHSKAVRVYEAVESLFAANADAMEAHGIFHAFLLSSIDGQCIVLEPIFYWRDALLDLHRATLEAATLKRIDRYEENPAAYAEVLRIREELVRLLSSLGAVHLQIGRRYPFLAGISPQARELVADLKKCLDPHRRINPGALGL